MKNANLWTLVVFTISPFLEFILNFCSLWPLEVIPSWSLYVFKLWWGLSWLFDCFQNNINMFRVSNKEFSFLRKERLTDKKTCVIFWYLFNLFDVLGEYKIILLEDSLKLIITFGFVSSRYSTSVCVRFNHERLTSTCLCNAGFYPAFCNVAFWLNKDGS